MWFLECTALDFEQCYKKTRINLEAVSVFRNVFTQLILIAETSVWKEYQDRENGNHICKLRLYHLKLLIDIFI